MFTRVSQRARSLLRRYYFFIYAYNLMLNCIRRGRNRHAGILPSGPLDREVRLVKPHGSSVAYLRSRTLAQCGNDAEEQG